MPRILRNLKINEVSGVDRGAGQGVKIMLMKRDDGSRANETAALSALNSAIASIIADDGITDKLSKVDESIAQFKTYTKQESVDMTPDEIKKMLDEAVATAVAKALALKADSVEKDDDEDVEKAKKPPPDDDMDDGSAKKGKKKPLHDSKGPDIEDGPGSPGTSTNKRFESIEKENGDLRKQLNTLLGERRDAEFAKRAVETGLKIEDGIVMRKAFDGDPEAQTQLLKRFDETQKALKSQIKTSVVFGEFGKGGPDKGATAYQEIEIKASELRKADPKLTAAQAFSKAYTDPANAEIVARDKQEQESKRLRAAGAL